MKNPETSISIEYLDSLLSCAERSESIFWDKELVISFKLASGFTILGRAAVIDPEDFVLETGRSIAYKDAISQLWALEGYVLQLKLAGQVNDLRNP